MKKEKILSLLAKYAESHEYFIIKYTTGKTCLAQFNLFGTLCWSENSGARVPSLLVVDYVEEILPFKAIKGQFNRDLSENELISELIKKHKIRISIANFAKRFAIWMERKILEGSK